MSKLIVALPFVSMAVMMYMQGKVLAGVAWTIGAIILIVKA